MSLTNRIEKLETTADQNQWHGRLDHAAIDAARAAEMDRWTSDELRFFRDLNLRAARFHGAVHGQEPAHRRVARQGQDDQ